MSTELIQASEAIRWQPSWRAKLAVFMAPTIIMGAYCVWRMHDETKQGLLIAQNSITPFVASFGVCPKEFDIRGASREIVARRIDLKSGQTFYSVRTNRLFAKKMEVSCPANSGRTPSRINLGQALNKHQRLTRSPPG